METGQRLLFGAVSTVVFCISLSLLILQTKRITSMFDTIRDQIKDDELYQQNCGKEIETVCYAEVIAILLCELEYDIVIDGLSIKRNEHSIDQISEYNLTAGEYRKQYQYDTNGNIALITYTRIN